MNLCLRSNLSLGLLAATLWTLPCPSLQAQQDRVGVAVAKGVRFIMTLQAPDGSFNDPVDRSRHRSVMTAMALLSMAAVGNQPIDPTPEGAAMRKGLDYLTQPALISAEGYYGDYDSSRMYGHGIITLALCEMLGMGVNEEQDARIRERATKAIELILRSQRHPKHAVRYEGGWRYTPNAHDADLSITVWQLMALRSARNAGIPVPKTAIDAAVLYLKRSYKSDRDAQDRPIDLKSSFGYQPGRPPEYATAAAGLLALQVCGEYNAPEVIGSAEWLMDLTANAPIEGPANRTGYGRKWFFYGSYYFAQGMQKRGGEYARKAREFIETIMVANQSADGSWTTGDGQERGAGRIYTTGLAILSLSIKYHYLPIYQH